MPTPRPVAAIGARCDVQHRAVIEAGGCADGVFSLAIITIEFEGPVALQHVPNLVDGDFVAIVVRERKEREVGDGHRHAEQFGTAVDRKERGHGLVIFREQDGQDTCRD